MSLVIGDFYIQNKQLTKLYKLFSESEGEGHTLYYGPGWLVKEYINWMTKRFL